MKLFKYLLLLFVGISFAACEEDEVKVNTASGVTVEFASDSLKTQEGVALAQIPVVIKGEPNGKVKVTIEVRQADNTDEPAIEDVHYYVTTKELWIYPNTKEAAFEIVPIDNRDQVDGRTFIMTITSAEGAQVGTLSQAIGFIGDNDTRTYDRLGGEWTVTFDESDDGPKTVNAKIETYPYDDLRYNRMLMATADWMNFGGEGTLDLSYSEAGHFVGLMANSKVIGPLNFTNYGPCNIMTGVNVNGQPSLSGSIPGNWNEDLTEINFGDGEVLMVVVSTEDNEVIGGNVTVGVYTSWENIRFTRSLEE